VHILVADDDSISRTLLARTLEHWGHEVTAVVDGLDACGRLIAAGAPTLAILDWAMPGLEGPEICRQIRAAALRMQPYLVILTARHTPEDLAVALEAGADDFLSKPFNRVELMARLHAGMRILNLHRALTDRIQELEESRLREQHLRTLMPICAYCKKIRGDKDEWEPIDQYLAEHGYRFTHAVCPSCLDSLAPAPRPDRRRQPAGESSVE
jgi:DNA-binding response OmpR family regulator